MPTGTLKHAFLDTFEPDADGGMTGSYGGIEVHVLPGWSLDDDGTGRDDQLVATASFDGKGLGVLEWFQGDFRHIVNGRNVTQRSNYQLRTALSYFHQYLVAGVKENHREAQRRIAGPVRQRRIIQHPGNNPDGHLLADAESCGWTDNDGWILRCRAGGEADVRSGKPTHCPFCAAKLHDALPWLSSLPRIGAKRLRVFLDAFQHSTTLDVGANLAGVSPTTFRKHLEELQMGYAPPAQITVERLSPQRDRFLRLYWLYRDPNPIARRLGVSVDEVRTFTKHLGLAMYGAPAWEREATLRAHGLLETAKSPEPQATPAAVTP